MISSKCEPGLKRAAKSAFNKLDVELQNSIIDNLDSICFGRKDDLRNKNGKFRIIIHEALWWFLPAEARIGKIAASINDVLIFIYPPLYRKQWEKGEQYCRKTLPHLKFWLLCREMLKNGVSVDSVTKLTMEKIGEIDAVPIR